MQVFQYYHKTLCISVCVCELGILVARLLIKQGLYQIFSGFTVLPAEAHHFQKVVVLINTITINAAFIFAFNGILTLKPGSKKKKKKSF